MIFAPLNSNFPIFGFLIAVQPRSPFFLKILRIVVRETREHLIDATPADLVMLSFCLLNSFAQLFVFVAHFFGFAGSA